MGADSAATVLLIPSQDVGWADLRATIQAMEGIQVVGEARACDEALSLAAALHPGVVLAAPSVQGCSTVSLITRLSQADDPPDTIVVLSPRMDSTQAIAFSRAGADGFLLWQDLSTDTLPKCLSVLATGTFMVGSRAYAQAILDAGRSPTASDGLTNRERQLLRRLADGLTESEVARAEYLSVRTVRRGITDVRRKLRAPSMFVLGMLADRMRLLD
jgi:DNA-binding NarL/FixJ family response regulator